MRFICNYTTKVSPKLAVRCNIYLYISIDKSMMFDIGLWLKISADMRYRLAFVGVKDFKKMYLKQCGFEQLTVLYSVRILLMVRAVCILLLKGILSSRVLQRTCNGFPQRDNRRTMDFIAQAGYLCKLSIYTDFGLLKSP